jgi:hypothetical protein
MKVTNVVLEAADATNIVTTALEGGINYWGECKDYRWKGWYVDADAKYGDPNYDKLRHIPKDEVLAYVREDLDASGGDEPVYRGNPWFALTTANLEEAVIKVLNSEYAPLVKIRDNEIDVDATGAEVIVQFAVFGEVIFA